MTILVGDPISFDDIITEGANQNISRGKLYDAVSARIGDRLQKLKMQVEALAIEQSLQLHEHPSHAADRAAGLLQNVDWESLGMGSYVSVDDNSRRKDLQLESSSAETYPQESNVEDGRFRAGFASGGGFASRIRGYMDSTELVVFAARGLFANRRSNEYFNSVQGESPLKVWNSFWKSASGNDQFPLNSVLSDSMRC